MQFANRYKEKLKKYKDTNIGDLILGSGFNSIAKVTATGLGFIGSIMIARFYSADLLGKIATISSMLSILTVFAVLGNDTYILRTIPQKIELLGFVHARRVFLKITTLVFASTFVVISIVFFTLAAKENVFAVAKQFEFLLYGLVLATCFKKISIKTLRALGDYKIFSTFEILPPLLMMLFVLVAVVLRLEDGSFIYFYYTPHFILALLAFYLAYRGFPNHILGNSGIQNPRSISTQHQAIPTYSGILKVSIPMLGVTVSNVVITNTDILMLASFTDDATVGVYSVYVKLGALMSIAITAVNSMYAPKAAKLYGAGKIQELKILTKRATLLSFSVSCAIFLVITLVHQPVLSFYGPIFLLHTTTFYILLFSLLCNAFYGSIGMLLNMTGKQNRFFLIMLSAAILNIVLNYILIPQLGPVGAALATLATVLYWNTLAAITVKKAYNFTTFPSAFINKLPAHT